MPAITIKRRNNGTVCWEGEAENLKEDLMKTYTTGRGKDRAEIIIDSNLLDEIRRLGSDGARRGLAARRAISEACVGYFRGIRGYDDVLRGAARGGWEDYDEWRESIRVEGARV